MRPQDTGMGLLLFLILFFGIGMMYPDAFGNLVVVAVVAGLLAILAMVVYVGFWLVRNRYAKVERVAAKVVRKHPREWDVTLVGETPEMAAARLGMMGRDPKAAAEAYTKACASPDVPEVTLYDSMDYHVTFAFNGKEADFVVPEDVYTSIDEGTEGLLVYQGEQFKYFIT